MPSSIKRLQELDDELKKVLQDATDKLIGREESIRRLALIRKEINALTSQIKSSKKK